MSSRGMFRVLSGFLCVGAKRGSLCGNPGISCLVNGQERLFSTLPTTMHDIGKHGKATFRQMGTHDFSAVCRFLLDRENIIDFGESDLSFMLEGSNVSNGAVGVIAEMPQDGIIAFQFLMEYPNGVTGGCFRYVDNKFRREGLGFAFLRYMVNNVNYDRLIGYKAKDMDYSPFGYSHDESGTFSVWDGFLPRCVTGADLPEGLSYKPIANYTNDILFDYDSLIHKIPRREVLNSMITHPMTKGFVALEDEQVRGYVLVRHCVDNRYKIAPLFADAPQIALALLDQCGKILKSDTPVTITSTSHNVFMENFLERNNFRKTKTRYSIQSLDGSGPILSRGDFEKVFGMTGIQYSVC